MKGVGFISSSINQSSADCFLYTCLCVRHLCNKKGTGGITDDLKSLKIYFVREVSHVRQLVDSYKAVCLKGQSRPNSRFPQHSVS